MADNVDATASSSAAPKPAASRVPARLTSRVGPPGGAASSTTSSIDAKSIEVTALDIATRLGEMYQWECSICCEWQPLSSPSVEQLVYAEASARRTLYSAACAEARKPAKHPNPLPTPTPPLFDAECLARQKCRDCGADGMQCMQGIPKVRATAAAAPAAASSSSSLVTSSLDSSAPFSTSSLVSSSPLVSTGSLVPSSAPASSSASSPLAIAGVEPVNYKLLRQLVASSLGNNDLAAADAHLASHNLATPEAVLAVLESAGPEWPTENPTGPSGKGAPEAANLLRGPLWGVTRHPIAALGYDHSMLAHDLPMHYPGSGSKEALAELEAEAAEMATMSGPCYSPGPVEAFPDMHPERPDRLRAAAGYLVAAGLWEGFHRVQARKATEEEIALAATPKQYARLKAIEAETARGGNINLGDTYYNENTLHAALVALGTTIEVAEAVASGKAGRGLALVRPPGHHADCSHSGGFCIFNSVGAAAKAVLQRHRSRVRRVLILDWDIHHGDGTETMFYEDPNVLYISIHRYDNKDYYPKTGHAESVGKGAGKGYNINIPLDGTMYGDADYLALFDAVVMPVARSFSPDFVFISAGFDAARGDWLGDFDVTPAGYAHMTHALASLAGGRVVVALEGGYNLNAVATSTAAVSRVLLGDAPIPLEAYDGIPNNFVAAPAGAAAGAAARAAAGAAPAAEIVPVAAEPIGAEPAGAEPAAAGAAVPEKRRTSDRLAPKPSPSLGHPRRTPQAGTINAIRTVVDHHAQFWPVLMPLAALMKFSAAADLSKVFGGMGLK